MGIDDDDNNASWQQQFIGKQFTQLPTIWRNGSCLTNLNNTHTVSQNTEVTGIISKEVILSAWSSVLSLFTGLTEVVFVTSLEYGFSGSESSASIFTFALKLSPDDDPAHTVKCVTDSLAQTRSHKSLTVAQIRNFDRIASTKHNSGTLVRIQESNDSRNGCSVDDAADDNGFTITISFRRLSSSTNIVVFFRQDLYTHTYVSEILRLTLLNIDRLLQKPKDLDQCVNLDLVTSFVQPCETLPHKPLLHTKVEHQSQRTPNAIAIGESERVMTYRELNSGADLLASSLVAGLPDNQVVRNVGIYFEKSSFAIMSMLAVLKIGGTYVPLDVAWPQQRIATIIENANISTILCSHTQYDNLKNHSLRIITVDAETIHKLKQRPATQLNEKPSIDPSHAAYMLYTSGSTGVPKGISVSHAAITTSIQAIARRLNINSQTRTFQYTTFTFDLNIADIWMTLSQGGRICSPTEDERLNPDDFIAQERCNYAMITPTAASTIKKTVLHRDVKTLALIGEAVPERLLRDIATPDASLNLYNTWGPTEACVIASSSKCITLQDDSSPSLHPNNIGYPIGCSMVLVSPTNPHKLAHAFAPGEIALVGYTLANGYYGNVTKTDEAFRHDLEWTQNQALQARVGGAAALETVYLTGDIGRYDPKADGSIIFMHRKEGGYIKINGYRVDPGEVESRINDLVPETLSKRDVCVLCHEQSDDEIEGARQVLVCFFVGGQGQATPGAACKILELKEKIREALKQVPEQLRETMPEYMIPRLFVPLEAMPILTSHKIDRKALLEALQNISWQELMKRFGL